MCGMMMGVMGAGLSMMGQAAAYQEKVDQVNEYNREAAVNARDAGIAASNKYADLQRKYIYDARQNQQEGQLAFIKGLEAKGTAVASAGSAGIDVGSFSVTDILSNMDRQTANALDNNKTKMQDLQDSYRSDAATTNAEAQGRINSMPYKPLPSSDSLMIGMASSAVGGLKGLVQ